jgi:pyruvate/2-oxoglutarate dehydrogenase complex dihydrolipoamide dehydrogenase (E3) component
MSPLSGTIPRLCPSMNEAEVFDFAVIGGGSAGYAGARTAHSLGLKTVVIDGADELGGLCILRGCMPSKTLIESTNRNLVVHEAAKFGLEAKAGNPDIAFIRERKRRLIGEFSSYRQGQLADDRFTLLRGFARFARSDNDSCCKLEVQLKDGTTQQVLARSVLIATGSVLSAPPLPGLEETGYWTSDTILDAAELPESFIVLGGGAIALEMAHYLHGMNRMCTVIQRSKQVLSSMDEDIADVVQEAFEQRGIVIHTDVSLQSVEQAATGKRVTFQGRQSGDTRQVEAAEILMALGRRPATQSLGLDAVGVSLQKSGHLEVSDTQQSSNSRVFAAGDVCGPVEVVHLAIQQGETAAKNAAQLLQGSAPTHRMDYRCKLFGVFTEPQAAAVGLSEKEAQELGISYLTSSYPFNDHGKSIIMDEMHGFVKLLAEPQSGAILGGSVVGPEATELIHEIAVAMHLNATVAQLAAAPHYHPTLSEIWTYPAEELAELVEVKNATSK